METIKLKEDYSKIFNSQRKSTIIGFVVFCLFMASIGLLFFKNLREELLYYIIPGCLLIVLIILIIKSIKSSEKLDDKIINDMLSNIGKTKEECVIFKGMDITNSIFFNPENMLLVKLKDYNYSEAIVFQTNEIETLEPIIKPSKIKQELLKVGDFKYLMGGAMVGGIAGVAFVAALKGIFSDNGISNFYTGIEIKLTNNTILECCFYKSNYEDGDISKLVDEKFKPVLVFTSEIQKYSRK